MNTLLERASILDELSQYVYLKSVDFEYIYINKALSTLLGRSSENILFKNDFDLFSEDIAQRSRADDILVMQSNREITRVEKIYLKGHERVLKSIKKPLFKDGKLYGVLGEFLDITEHTLERRSHQKLCYGLNKAQELAKIGHWELDNRRDALFWSDEVYRIFGAKPQAFEPTNEKFFSFVHPEDRELVYQSYQKSLQEKSYYHIVHRIIKENNEIAFAEERCIHQLDREGNITRSIGTIHDITQERIAQNELMLSAEVFARMSDAVVITDENRVIIKVNEAFSKITGYTQSEVVGEQTSMLNSGRHSKEFHEDMWQQINSNGEYHGEVEDRKKSGEVYISDITIMAIHNEHQLLTNYISIFSDVTDTKVKDTLIHNLAYYDHLTKLPNRTLFQERFLDKVKYAKRNQKKIAMLFLDMDNFKNINDTMGHLVGDKFLIEVVSTLKSNLRAQDTIARQGGDEFTILIDNFEKIEDILPLIEKIVNRFKSPLMVENTKLYSGVSMGISIYPDDGKDFIKLVKCADTAMYHVKENGKSGFHFFTNEINKKVTQRINLENRLRSALSNNEFFLLYQPKIDMKLQSVYGMEALIRWQSPIGLVPPDQFISVAEDIGLIYDIGLWVIKKSLHDLQQLHKEGYLLTLSINVSSMQFENKNFIDDLSAIIEEFSVESSYIELEVTETQIMTNIQSTLVKLSHLHSLGFKISIDDFGTGYSSLSYLKRLPAQTIKIDRSFVLDIEHDEEDKSIVSAIIAMANSLGKDVIAEGSETQGHIDTLKTLNCHKIQGYYFSKPLEKEIFRAYVENFSLENYTKISLAI